MSNLSGEGATGPADERPLTDVEYQQVQRLFGDPFSFPITFKSWLISYLESSDLTLPMSAILGLTSMLGISGVGGGSLGIFPAGVILPYGGDNAPPGSLLCDGGSYPTTSQKRLYDAIGFRYGGGGSVFNVPDLRDRVPTGKGVHSDHDTLGKNDGSALGTRRTKHRHQSVGMHNTGIASGTDDITVPTGTIMEPFVTETAAHDHAPVDGLPAPTDGPAFLTINFVIIN